MLLVEAISPLWMSTNNYCYETNCRHTSFPGFYCLCTSFTATLNLCITIDTEVKSRLALLSIYGCLVFSFALAFHHH